MSIATSDRPDAHVNRSVKRRSGAVSLRRVNSISNAPEMVEHGDASATSTPLHVLCEFRGSEMRTSPNDNAGLHRGERDEAGGQQNRRMRETHLGLLAIADARAESGTKSVVALRRSWSAMTRGRGAPSRSWFYGADPTKSPLCLPCRTISRQ